MCVCGTLSTRNYVYIRLIFFQGKLPGLCLAARFLECKCYIFVLQYKLQVYDTGGPTSITLKRVIDLPVHQRISCQYHVLLCRGMNITCVYEGAVPAGGNKTTHLGLGQTSWLALNNVFSYNGSISYEKVTPPFSFVLLRMSSNTCQFPLVTCIQSYQNKLPSSQETTSLGLGNKTT